MPFLPINHHEMLQANIIKPDFVFVTGDAYCDHPSFGTAIIARMLERFGYTVCILSQPDVLNPKVWLEFGFPRLGWLVNSGNIDSMVNHYTVGKRRRKTDSYTPGGIVGKRPDRAIIKYCTEIRKTDPNATIIIGGIEASLRRLSHYDYWDDLVKKSIIIDSQANLLVYGMGEKTIIEIADYLASGLKIQDLIFIKGTVWKTNDSLQIPKDAIKLPAYEIIRNDKKAYAESFMMQYNNTDSIVGKPLCEPYQSEYVIQNSPREPLTRDEMDQVYDLPFMRAPHPMLESIGHIAAMDEIRHSITINRGCYGACSFCALTMHQGRVIQSRSKDSVIKEAKQIIADSEFKGYIHDVGGPTANFYNPSCDKQLDYGVCTNKQCLHPTPCKNLKIDHTEYLDILRTLRELDGIKKVFVRSGVRYDYVMYDKNGDFLRELVQYHVSGQLKVAPEHVSDEVLDLMGKPRKALYDRFVERFFQLNSDLHKEQYLVPYLMSSHPGSTLKDAIILAEYIRDIGYNPEQVQDFYPTPATLSTTMYHTGVDPRTMKPVYIPKSQHEKAMQRALIQYRDPKNYALVLEALTKANRTDLIGSGEKCLIRLR
ncbi:MAG: YgiQ family radical SAM protein [Candidatus Izemoplasmatales bacterium]|nr:YgiQ family radical SAM protein [Candidatus Izemoplasmatales bacterium]